MKKEPLFTYLAQQEKSTLLQLLSDTYDLLDHDDRVDTFGKYEQAAPQPPVDGVALIQEIETFRDQSLAGYYYEPFNINSRNFSHVPEETNDWFEKISDRLLDATELVEQGNFATAVTAFEILFFLIDKMEDGEEIVFADSLGSWMIMADEAVYTRAYLRALAETTTPANFATVVALLVQRDSYQSFAAKVYETALALANKQQAASLAKEVARLKIRTEPRRFN